MELSNLIELFISVFRECFLNWIAIKNKNGIGQNNNKRPPEKEESFNIINNNSTIHAHKYKALNTLNKFPTVLS